MSIVILVLFYCIQKNLLVLAKIQFINEEKSKKDYISSIEDDDVEYVNNYYDGTSYPPDDTPDPDIEYSSAIVHYDSETTEENDSGNDSIFTKILLNGTAEEVKKIDRNSIVRALPDINKVQISLNKKLIIWEIVKENKSVKTFTRADLERTGNILLTIPELDLFNLNFSDWNIVDYLGTVDGLGRRRVGIVGYALKQLWGEDILNNAQYLNRLKGLICGFAPYDLLHIETSTFIQISIDVFENIKSCTRRQTNVLIHTAMLTTAYGPPQAWTANNTAVLALLLKAVKADDLKTIRPAAMEGINYLTIQAMTTEQLRVFNAEQLSYLSDLSLAAYRTLTGIDSNSNRSSKLISKYLNNYLLVLAFCLQYTC